jgi:hypothetical protein
MTKRTRLKVETSTGTIIRNTVYDRYEDAYNAFHLVIDTWQRTGFTPETSADSLITHKPAHVARTNDLCIYCWDDTRRVARVEIMTEREGTPVDYHLI